MMRLLILSSILLFPCFVQAGLMECLISNLKKAYFQVLFKNAEHSTLYVKDTATNQAYTLSLGHKLGSGASGSVYHSDGIEGIGAGPYAVKVAHVIERSHYIKNPHSNNAIRLEWDSYQTLSQQFFEYEKLLTQKGVDNPWGTHKHPFVPIVKKIEDANFGLIIVKPKITGKTIKQVIKDNGGKMPANLRQQLEYYYYLCNLKTDGRRQINLDLNPENFFWVEDVSTLRQLGLDQPSLVLIETGPDRFLTPLRLNSSLNNFIRNYYY